MNKYFDTYAIATEYYHYLQSRVDKRLTIMRRGDKYVVGIDPAYVYEQFGSVTSETPLQRKARERDSKIDEILGCQ